MFIVLGGMIGFWLIYALLACIFKHNISLIITTILGLGAGICSAIILGNYFTIIATVVASTLIYFCVPLQIKSKKKEMMKQRKQNKSEEK